MPYYKNKTSVLKNSETYSTYCISIPIYTTLEIEDQRRVIDLIFNFYKK